MKTTRSAQAAADGSWVTITSVRPPRVDGVAQQREHLAPGTQVQRARRLVREDDLGLADQRAGDRHALLLAAGELRRAVPGAVGQADGGERLADGAARSRRPASRDGSATFCAAVSAREQVEGLKDEADPLAPQPRQRTLAQAAELDVAEVHAPPSVGRSSPAADCSRVDLPEPEGPITAVKVPRLEGEARRRRARGRCRRRSRSRGSRESSRRRDHRLRQAPSPGRRCRWGAGGDPRFGIATRDLRQTPRT